MRRVWNLFGLPLATLLTALGCANPDANLQPRPHAEAYNLPPENDTKLSQPTTYPKSLLFQDSIHTQGGDAGGPPGAGGSRLGGGPGGMR
jgi:hypothetical protein